MRLFKNELSTHPEKAARICAFIFTGVITLFRLTHIGRLGLTADEAYFWEWSRHLGVAYSDQGPVLGLSIYLTTQLLGFTTELSVRLLSIFYGLGTIILVYSLASSIFKNEWAGAIAVFTLNAIPMCAAGGMLITADVPMIFFWTLALFCSHKALNSSIKPRLWWYLAGISSSFGIMSKYTSVFFIFSIFLYVLFSKKQRTWLLKKEPYLAFLISLTGFIPEIIYNLKNNWPTYGYIRSLFFSGEYTYSGVPGLKGLAEYIVGQLAVATPFLGLIFIYLLVYLLLNGRKNKNENYIFLFFTSFTVLFVFGIMSFFSSVEENWPVPAYVSLSIATGGFLATELFKNLKTKKIFATYASFSLILGFTLSVIFYIQALYTIFTLPEWMDPSDKARGWKQLGAEASQILDELPGNKFILTNYFGIAGELAFYMKGQPEIRCIDAGQRLREYRYWSNFDSQEGQNAIYITAYPKIEPLVNSLFGSIEPVRTINIYRNSLLIKRFYAYRCLNFKGGYIIPRSPTLF